MHRFHHKQFLSAALAATALLIFSLLLTLTYRYDNKYTAGPPYGENGVITLTEDDLHSPVFLVDGWLLDGQEVFIGQYSNFSYLPGHSSPFGAGTYSLTLHYEGTPQTLLMEIPVIFTEFTLYINGTPTASGSSETQVTVPVGGQDTLITLETYNADHYYSGLTYPPAMGTAPVIGQMFFIRTLIYTAIVFSGLTLAIFSMALWLSKYRSRMFFHFGLLCLAFSVNCAHPLMGQWGLSGRLWYALEDVSWLFVLAETVFLAALAAHQDNKKWFRLVLRPATLCFCLLAIISVLFIIPANGGWIGCYGALVDGYRITLWGILAILAGMGIYQKAAQTATERSETVETYGAPYLLGAAGIVGISILVDVLDSNLFEPIYGLWQNEYAGVLMVMLFGVMMVQRIRALQRESRQLQALSLQYRFAEESASQMRQSARQLRTMKHELNHHIEAMSALFANGDLPRLDEYLSGLRSAKNALPALSYSENFLVNAILTSYLEPARQKGITVDCHVLVPEQIPVSDAELCTLLSNILQNAVEACTKIMEPASQSIHTEPADHKECPLPMTPFIRFEMTLRDQLLTFTCINTSAGGDSFGPFPTTKSDQENHGLGLSAITRIVQKHKGTVSTVKKDGCFTVRGVLPLPLHE